jgi:TM2 domain-containing membrane protein YozV
MDASMETTTCFFCEAEISVSAKKCRHCGEWLARDCSGCGLSLRFSRAARGVCEQCEGQSRTAAVQVNTPIVVSGGKSRGLAAVLALVLGGLGFHKFYLGRVGWGVIYFLFCWTFIPSILGFFEGISYALSSEEAFQKKYATPMMVAPPA